MRQGSAKQLGHRDKWDTSGVLVDLPSDGPIDPVELFGNTRPVECEIGCGKGTFLLTRAAVRPEVNLLGIEYARSYCRYTADRARRARLRAAETAGDDAAPGGLADVRMLHADAGDVFARLPDASLIRVHIYFPDPWPKRRHHRRRLIQPPFVDLLRRVLSPGGELLVVTDHLGYFEHIRRVLTDAPCFARIRFPRMADATGEQVGTNFERKYIAQGRAFYHLARLRYARG